MSTKKEEEKKHIPHGDIQAKADELAKQLGLHKVIPLVFVEDGEQIVGYLKEPTRQAKIAVLDKAVMGGYSAAEEVMQDLVLKEYSDPRILSEKPEHDRIYLGAVMEVYNTIRFSVNTLKKK